jgi:hypothetical protein
MDWNERRLVEDTLRPLEGSRRAYRLVGEVLVERSVAEVLPSVVSNRENVSYLQAWLIFAETQLIADSFLVSPLLCPRGRYSSKQPSGPYTNV